jgi:phthalate 4,5-dioxygenase
VRALTPEELQAMKDGHGVHSRNIPGTYRPVENKDVDYLMDREAQRRGEMFSGVRGIAQQDASLQESMGPIVDRTKERLVASDTGIIKARKKLRTAVEALRDEGVTPPGVDPAHHRVRSAAVVLPQAESFIEASRDAVRVRPGEAHASV